MCASVLSCVVCAGSARGAGAGQGILCARGDPSGRELEGRVGKHISFVGEDARPVQSGDDLVFVAKAIERGGDQAKTLAEQVIYIVKGEDVRNNSVGMVETLVR